MSLDNPYSSLFAHSSFAFIKRNSENEFLPNDCFDFSDLDKDKMIKFHPVRLEEFKMGRECAKKAYKSHFNQELFSLGINDDRSPQWPTGVVGSITHSSHFVGAAVSSSDKLLGLGIDFEILGRMKLKLARIITNDKDLRKHSSFKDEELLALIFSAKESLYKALFPITKEFFGFNTAAVKEINMSDSSFRIELISDISSGINSGFGPNGLFSFEGKFKIIGKDCLTVLEIKK